MNFRKLCKLVLELDKEEKKIQLLSICAENVSSLV